jgi:hypothetical protein
VRLAAEALEPREVPAVGKWLPPPSLPETKDSVNTVTLVRVASTSLTDTRVILQPIALGTGGIALSGTPSQPALMVPTETGNP